MKKLSCKEANKISIVTYLSSIGLVERYIRGQDYWYLSPFRKEATPSFKVNTNLNVWYDHGMGRGGTLIDFGLLYHHCSIPELLQRLQHLNFSFHQHTSTPIAPLHAGEKDLDKIYSQVDKNRHRNNELHPFADEKGKIEIDSIRPLQSSMLRDYLNQRSILFDTAKRFCSEVQFRLYDKPYTALGFKNIDGGFELRNKYFKGSSSPKNITIIESPEANISVFEGFMDFLSYASEIDEQGKNLTNILVLNSLAFLGKSIDTLKNYPQVDLYLDNDTAGNNATNKLLSQSANFKDCRKLYQGFKDINDWRKQKCNLKTQRMKRGRKL